MIQYELRDEELGKVTGGSINEITITKRLDKASVNFLVDEPPPPPPPPPR